MNKTWRYPPQPARFDKPGKFIGWIAGSGAHREGSAAAFRLERVNDPADFYEDALPSTGFSTSVRGHLGALIGSIEALPPHSELEVRTRNKYVVNLVNHDLSVWKANGWDKLDGEQAKNSDALEYLSDLLSAKGIVIIATFVESDASDDGVVIAHLRNWANRTRRKAA